MSSRSAKIVQLARQQSEIANQNYKLLADISNTYNNLENSTDNKVINTEEKSDGNSDCFDIENLSIICLENAVNIPQKEETLVHQGKETECQNIEFFGATTSCTLEVTGQKEVDDETVVTEVGTLTNLRSEHLPEELSNEDSRKIVVLQNIRLYNAEDYNVDTYLGNDATYQPETQEQDIVNVAAEIHNACNNNNYFQFSNQPTNERKYQEKDEINVESDSIDDYLRNDPTYEPAAENEYNGTVVSDSDASLDALSNNNNNYLRTGRPRKGRKRKHDLQDRVIRKTLKNSNKPYITARGNQIMAKEFVDYKCKCSTKCHEKIETEDRQLEFRKFWELADYTTQNAYITSCMNEQPIKRRYVTAGGTNRQFSRQYFVKKIPVCRDMFATSFGISTKRINTAIVKLRSSSFLDKRGKHDNHRKMNQEVCSSIIDQIEKLPKYRSHYCRESTAGVRQYLLSELNLRKIYELYRSENPHFKVSLSQYKILFYSNFNLHFKPLKSDTCNLCDNINARFNNEIIEAKIMELKRQLEEHQSLASLARSKMKTDMEDAKRINSIETLTFDLEKTLPLPRLTTNIIFYKRQLWVYNLGIHSGKENKGNCMVWVEGEAGRGAQEVGSCLSKYISLKVGSEIEELRLWSDSCGGQNRNIKLVLMLRHVLSNHPSLKKVTLNFLVSGHSFLPNDADFSDIEKALKYQQRIYTPEEYIHVMKNCRRNRLNTHRMQKEDFFATCNLEKNITNRKIDISGEKKINWLQLKQIKLEKNEPMILYTKDNYDEEAPYDKINISKKNKRRSISLGIQDTLTPLWPQGKPISEEKLKDLKSIYHLIPSDVLPFYTNLNADFAIQEDLEGFNGSLDFDIESD